jgi:hypothetical protein
MLSFFRRFDFDIIARDSEKRYYIIPFIRVTIRFNLIALMCCFFRGQGFVITYIKKSYYYD